MWSAAQRQKKIYRFDVHAGFEGNYSVCLCGHVLRREDSHILRRALDFELKGRRGRSKRMW